MRIRQSFWRILFALVFLLTSLSSVPGQARALSSAETILQDLTPEERVGQLFLVGFEGATLEPESPIYDLIAKHHIGGVTLLAENNNFGSEDTLQQAQALISDLQSLEWAGANPDELTPEEPVVVSDSTDAYVPLTGRHRPIGQWRAGR